MYDWECGGAAFESNTGVCTIFDTDGEKERPEGFGCSPEIHDTLLYGYDPVLGVANNCTISAGTCGQAAYDGYMDPGA